MIGVENRCFSFVFGSKDLGWGLLIPHVDNGSGVGDVRASDFFAIFCF